MRNFITIALTLLSLEFSFEVLAKDVVCSKENYSIEVEFKHLEYDPQEKPYYIRRFQPMPEDWSLAFPGLGKLRLKVAKSLPPPEAITLEYRSMDARLLDSKEIKLTPLASPDGFTHGSQNDLEIEFKNFFKKAKEGKVQISVKSKTKVECSTFVRILGILEQN